MNYLNVLDRDSVHLHTHIFLRACVLAWSQDTSPCLNGKEVSRVCDIIYVYKMSLLHLGHWQSHIPLKSSG